MEVSKIQIPIPVTRAERYWAQLQGAENELDQISGELADLAAKRAELLLRKERLEATIDLLRPICEEQQSEEDNQRDALWADAANLGIQECCYRVLLESDKPLDATMIKLRLEGKIDLSDYKNALAVIHTSLRRIPDRVRSFREKARVGTDESRVAWVRFYEAIRPSVGAKTATTDKS